MPSYKYRVIYEDGKIGRGRILAKSKAHAIESLKNDNVQPVSIQRQNDPHKRFKKIDYKRLVRSQIMKNQNSREKHTQKEKIDWKNLTLRDLKKLEFHPFRHVTSKDIISFVNNFYILKKAKFTNVQALEALYNGVTNPAFKSIVEDLLIGVQDGEKIYKIMMSYPKVFPPIFVNFIKVGEESGTLDSALIYARDYVESSMALKKKIRASVIPRVLQFFGIIIMMCVAVVIGVPMLQDVYDMFDSSAEIPAATMGLLNAVNWLIANWYWVVLGIGVVVFGFLAIISTTRGRYNWDKFLFRCPVLGNVIRNITIEKFFLAMLLNLKNGLRLQESLEISKTVTNNLFFLSTVEIAKANAITGESWITPFVDNKIFTPMMSQMVSVGMKTDIVEMIEKVNVYIRQEIDESVAKFVKVLPDITYLFVGIALIAFVITIVVPIIGVYMGSFITIDSY